MTDYNDGKWHGHNGEQCPVHLKSEVEVVYHGLDGRPAYRTQAAGDLNWLNSKLIIAFRVIKQHREPLEYWIWTDNRGVVHVLNYHHAGSVHVREVLK